MTITSLSAYIFSLRKATSAVQHGIFVIVSRSTFTLSVPKTCANVLLSSFVKLCPYFRFIDNAFVNIFGISFLFGIEFDIAERIEH